MRRCPRVNTRCGAVAAPLRVMRCKLAWVYMMGGGRHGVWGVRFPVPGRNASLASLACGPALSSRLLPMCVGGAAVWGVSCAVQ